jgi:hypothetical protein
MATANTTFKIEHHHYHRLDPVTFPEPALFKVNKAGALEAVVRDESPEQYRVDCVVADAELKGFLAGYFPGRTFAYFENTAWSWRDNGTHEAMPWETVVPAVGSAIASPRRSVPTLVPEPDTDATDSLEKRVDPDSGDPTAIPAYMIAHGFGEATCSAIAVDAATLVGALEAARPADPQPRLVPTPTPEPDTELCHMCAEIVPLASMIRWRTSPSLVGDDVPVYSCTHCHAAHKAGAPVLAKGSEWSVRRSGIFRAVRLPAPSKPPRRK